MLNKVPITLDYSYLLPEVTAEEIASLQPDVTKMHDALHMGTGLGSDYLGWMNPESFMSPATLQEITDTAARLRQEAEVMVVIGIGGSYLGARTVIEALAKPGAPQVWYAGHTLSDEYLAHLLTALEHKRFCLNVVSKSGTTTEPAVAFRLLRNLLERQVGKEKARDLIFATTDPNKGALRAMAGREGYRTFTIPANVGGRYSVFTAVGLFPIAFADVDVHGLFAGAVDCARATSSSDLAHNPAYVYAAARNILYRKGKTIELLASFEHRLHYLAEWWKQLYGESEGKDLKGIFPASVEFTTDLHSMGQWIQQGRREIFETFVNIANVNPSVIIPEELIDADELNYLRGLTVDAVNRRAYQGTALAHRDGGVPSMTLTLPDLTAYPFGALLYFFQKACGISGYLLGVNPFDQPGVESYKNNMFALLDKPGYQIEAVAVRAAVEARQGRNTVTF